MSKNNTWSFKQLSRYHKPTEQDEYQRIIEADGEIEAIEDDEVYDDFYAFLKDLPNFVGIDE